MTMVEVNPGICGMNTTIGVTKLNKRQFGVDITTDCEIITKMGELLGEIDLRDSLKPHIHSSIYQCATQCRVHISCPIPMAIIKAVEVEAGIALPRPVTVHFR